MTSSGIAPSTRAERSVRLALASIALALALLALAPPSADSTVLADGRGWEMVSPLEKNGGQVAAARQISGGAVLQASAGGEAVTFSSAASFGSGALGAPVASQYIARRGAAGWSTENITLPTLSGAYGEQPDGVPYQLFSPDLSRALMLDGARCGEPQDCPHSYSLLEPPGVTASTSVAEPDLGLAGASPDLRHVILSTCAALTDDASEVSSGGGGCEASATNLYEWSAGALQALNVLPGESHTTPGAVLAAPAGAVSTDGLRIYFSLLEDGAIYLREAGGSTKLLPETVGGGAAFQAASVDGSLAYFTKGRTLYRYDAEAESSQPLATGVKGVLGASEDGSIVYYQGASGLERWQEGSTTRVATGDEAAQESDYPPATGTARVSPDGRALAFLSEESLTGYDNTDQSTGQPDDEVFLYSSAAGGNLVCASCNPSGQRPLGPSSIPGAIPNGTGSMATDSYKPRDLTTAGTRLFFDSSDSLVLQDTDGRPNVYEWEAPGTGTCARVGGCLSLISSGRNSEASFFDAGAEGRDVFFLTDASLVPADPGSVDLYDAREGGGFPSSSPPIACEGDACQSLPPEPEDSTPGTLAPGSGQSRLHVVHLHLKPPHHRKHHHRRHRRHRGPR